jgi:hypothetical protein
LVLVFGICEDDPSAGEKSSIIKGGRLTSVPSVVVSELLVTSLIHSAIKSILDSASWHRCLSALDSQTKNWGNMC